LTVFNSDNTVIASPFLFSLTRQEEPPCPQQQIAVAGEAQEGPTSKNTSVSQSRQVPDLIPTRKFEEITGKTI
jgi:hypothetical protein